MVQVPQQRVVILGAGFGGLQAARMLRNAPVSITVVDRQNHHCFQPLLYQVATASLSPADIAWPIRQILRRQQNATVYMAEVLEIDPARNLIRTTGGEFGFDYLVVAAGSTYSYFGHDEWAAFAPGLKRISDATSIRRRILSAFERAEIIAGHESLCRQCLTFVIVGGGPTGVELAGAIAEVARQTLVRDFRRIDPRRSRIVLLEAGPRLLPDFSPQHSAYARKTLTAMGVDVMLSTRVTGCDAGGVELESGRIDAGCVIWAAGVVASPAARWLGAEHDKAGRIIVSPDLSLPGHDNIFIIGDGASVRDPNGKPVPGLAAAAKQMGNYVARLIGARVAGRQFAPFRYRDQGALATIGRRAAVVELGPLQLQGFVGWCFWSIVHIYFLIGLRNRFFVAATWLWSYITFQRGARLIT